MIRLIFSFKIFFLLSFFSNLSLSALPDKHEFLIEMNKQNETSFLNQALQNSILKILGSYDTYSKKENFFNTLNPKDFIDEFGSYNENDSYFSKIIIDASSLRNFLVKNGFDISSEIKSDLVGWILCDADLDSLDLYQRTRQKCEQIKNNLKNISRERNTDLFFPMLDSEDLISFKIQNEENELDFVYLSDRYKADSFFYCRLSLEYENCYLPDKNLSDRKLNFSKKFIRSMGLEPNLITTQIEPHDSIIESYHNILRINSILTDLCQDMWLYISRSIVKQKKLAGEIGSSTMPHKINPIQFENAEGNFGISNAILEFLARKLAISRMQRDLTDSTTIRNQGVALAHSYISLISIASGLGRIDIDLEKTEKELNDHWEVLTEPMQTAIRKSGKESGYEQMMDLSRGKKIDESMIKDVIDKLKISDEDKKSLLKLSPSSYTGLAEKLTDLL